MGRFQTGGRYQSGPEGDYDPFTAASPSVASEASGTTSKVLTFAAPTGGSGTYTAAAALTQATGSGASLSGTAPGNLTVSSLEDGDVVRVTVTYTDTVTSEAQWVSFTTTTGSIYLRSNWNSGTNNEASWVVCLERL